MEHEFINNSELIFNDISNEEYREYIFDSKTKIRLNKPIKLNVSASGGHKVFTSDGLSHYIPNKWIHLQWKVKAGRSHFDF